MADRLQESVEIIRRDRDRSRDFLADVSHELRTPLAALRMFNELLTKGAAEDPATRAEFLESSGQQIERLDWLAQNLLELSKLDSGLVLLDLRPDDLRAAVESAVEQSASNAERRGVKLSLTLPDAPVRVRHDPQRIGQVVANLVANAVKFTPRGGSVSVDVASTPDGARIEVADTGVGIEPAEMPHIFERFYRGSRANEARGSGSGLGLAIVHSIVDMHGGTVVVESRVGSGSRFVVTLPRDPRLVEGTPAAERAAVASAADAAARSPNMQETSPSERPQVNPEPAP
jgi:two-component system phosphate regulon sensor histidine kinase PhoR